MKMHKMRIAILSLLLPPALLWSQEVSEAPVQSTRAATNANGTAYAREGQRPEDLHPSIPRSRGTGRIISVLVPNTGASVAIDERSQSLIVAASPDRIQQIEQVIQALDSRPAGKPNTPQVMYRVYMVELPSQVEAIRPFSLMVTSLSGLSAADIVEAVETANIRLTNLEIASNGVSDSGEQTWR